MRWPPEPRLQLTGGPLLPAPDPVLPCCETSAHTDGEECTCWTSRLTVEPTDRLQEGPPVIRRTMCGDCAYRPGSREREEADGDPPGYSRARPFYCHTGMARAVGYSHPDVPGEVPDVTNSDYRCYLFADRAWKANGAPAELCAGWAAWTGARRLAP